jgi:hypothetical protein
MEDEKKLWKHLSNEREIAIRDIKKIEMDLSRSKKKLRTITIQQEYILNGIIPKFCNFCGYGVMVKNSDNMGDCSMCE